MTQEFSILDDFSLYLRDKGRKESTIVRYVYDLKYFFHFLQIKNEPTSNIWRNIEEKDYQSFISYLANEKKYSENTLYKTKIVLHMFQKFIQQYLQNDTVITLSVEKNKTVNKNLTENDFLKAKELNKIIRSLYSLEGFTDHQLEARKKLKLRNLAIFFLLIQHGITLQELTKISMNDISFIKNELYILNKKEGFRTLYLSTQAKKLLFTYLHNIPEPVRPRYNTNDPFFVSFDFNRKTFKWVYETDCPKRVTSIAIQKLIREQMKRADVRKGICAQTFRNTYILNLITQDFQEEQIMKYTGNISKNSLKPYNKYLIFSKQSALNELPTFLESKWEYETYLQL